MEKIANGVYSLTIGTPEQLTPMSVLRPQSRIEQLNGMEDCPPPFAAVQVRSRTTPRGLLLELPAEPEEDFYGLGLTLKSFRQSGLKKMLRTNSDPCADNGDSHAPVPFYVSTKGYAVYADTARYVTFYMGNVKTVGSRRDREGFASAGTEKGHWWIKPGSGNVFVDIPAAQGVTLYFFSGVSMKEAVARYNLFSGGGCQAPLSGMGIMYRGYMHGDAEHMIRLAEHLRREKMPCDVFGLEPGWQTHAYSCTYQWDPVRYPDPKDFLARMRKMGFGINLWEHAYVHPDSPIHGDIRPYSGDCYVWDGLVPDFTLEEACRIFTSVHERMVEEGVTGFKLDECDGSDLTSNWGFPNFMMFPGGMDGEQMHSLFGLLYQRAMLELYEKRGVRTYGEVFQSHAFASPYPYVLYSDLYDHADFIRGMASAAFSGILWTPEVRQADSAEELLRRIAAAVVSPQAVINAYMVRMPPWEQYDRELNLQEQWLPEEERTTLREQCRSLLQMRMRLAPHLYAAFDRYWRTGEPPVRPLVLDMPEDRETADLWDQFILGEGLMAAPVIAGTGLSRRIYFPRGVWYDLNTEERIEGGQWLERQVPLDQVPLFVREGTLLALARPTETLSGDGPTELELVACGAGTCTCELPEDDGITLRGEGEAGRFYRLTADDHGWQEAGSSERYRVIDYRRLN